MCLSSLYKTNTSELKTCDVKIMKSKINIYDIIREITSACIIMIFLIQHFEIYRTQAYLFSCGGGGERGGS